jgi:hypothetical protein
LLIDKNKEMVYNEKQHIGVIAPKKFLEENFNEKVCKAYFSRSRAPYDRCGICSMR